MLFISDRVTSRFAGLLFLDNNLFFDENLITREDEDMFRRIDALGQRIIYIENPVVHIRKFSVCSELRRYYHYGRGEYYLQKKWGTGSRLNYNIKSRIMEKRGYMTAFPLITIGKLRSMVSRIGYLSAKNSLG